MNFIINLTFVILIVVVTLASAFPRQETPLGGQQQIAERRRWKRDFTDLASFVYGLKAEQNSLVSEEVFSCPLCIRSEMKPKHRFSRDVHQARFSRDVHQARFSSLGLRRRLLNHKRREIMRFRRENQMK